MPPIKVRVRTPVRVATVEIELIETVARLKALVASALDTSVDKVVLSNQPNYSSPLNDNATLTSLSFRNGQMLYCPVDGKVVESNSSAATVSSAAAPDEDRPSESITLTARCQHGPRGRCQHCAPANQSDMDKLKSGPLNKAGGRHAEKSTKADDLSGEMEWLCRHRSDQMCVNCAPLQKGENVNLEMLCQHSPDQRCVNCLPPDSTVSNRKFITFEEYMMKRRVKCEHNFNAVCVNCIPPAASSYALKKNCPKHRPWPQGLCADCAPQPVEAKLQEYRHVDLVTFLNVDELGGFINLWSANAAAGVQRAAFLYGEVVRDDSNYIGGHRVVVHALYEPPQRFDPVSGAISIMSDKKAKDVASIAASLGLRKVGWLFTKPGDGSGGAAGKEAGSDAKNVPSSAVTPREIVAMAKLQNMHPRHDGVPGSQFVTVVVQKNAEGQIEPRAFMAADYLCALVRENLIANPLLSDRNVKIAVNKPQNDAFGKSKEEEPTPDVIVTSKDWGRQRKKEFDPDAALVTMEVVDANKKGSSSSTSANGKRAAGEKLFKYSNFPVENRNEFGIYQNLDAVRAYLKSHNSDPLDKKVLDFHFLLYLRDMYDIDTALLLAKAIAEGEPIPEGIEIMLSDMQ